MEVQNIVNKSLIFNSIHLLQMNYLSFIYSILKENKIFNEIFNERIIKKLKVL